MNRIAFLIICILPVSVLAVEPKKTFEVASVKPAAAPASGFDFHSARPASGPRFGPGTADPTRWACDNCALSLLLTQAYNLKRFQITGPAWLDSERFDITARVAAGATIDDLHLMQQTLLAERFGLKARVEKKEMQVYDLVVGKGTPKLKETAAAKPAAAEGHSTHSFGRGGDGVPNFTSDRTITITMHGATQHIAVGEDMHEFSDVLAAQLEKPVTDSTGLTGKYDFRLVFLGGKEAPGAGAMGAMMHGGPGGGGHGDAADSDPMSQPPLQKAIQDQLGLRLEAKKGAAELLIVEHLEKVPSAN